MSASGSCIVVARGKEYLVDYSEGAPERICLLTRRSVPGFAASWSRTSTRTIWRKGQRTQTPRVCAVFVAFRAEMISRVADALQATSEGEAS